MDINISDIAMKVLTEDEETLTFSIKVTVENNSPDSDVDVTLKGLDEEGFELYNFTLFGTIEPKSSRILTSLEEYVDKNLFNAITKWEIQ